MSTARIVNEISGMAVADRMGIISAVWNSIVAEGRVDEVPLTAEQDALLDQRAKYARENPGAGRPLADALDDLRKRL